jgi:Carboxypeptidase regulatory-like domain
MKILRWTLRAAALALAVVGGSLDLHAQGVTTGAVAGTVTDETGKPVESAQVKVVNRSSGFSTYSNTRVNGYYLVSNLESGGPYTVTVKRIGFLAAERTDVVVPLSQTTRIDFKLSRQAVALGAVQVIAASDAAIFSPTRQGVSTQVSDSLIQHLPQLTRNITDMVKLVPQVTGMSAGGMYNRLNNFMVDGASQNDRFNLASSGGIPGGAGGGRIISEDAVKEFKVLLSPTDVRQANFTGMLFNAVTKSGTNEFHGGAMYNYRNDANMASAGFRATPVNVRQYGFQFGGPIIKDKLQFYVAPEWQHKTSLAGGAFIGQPANATAVLNVPADSVALIQSIVQAKMGLDAGTSGRLDIKNPLTNLFGRLDYQVSDGERIVFRQLINRTDNTSFSRNNNTFTANPLTQTSGFRLGSNSFIGVDNNKSSTVQLFSNLASGISNEFLVGINSISDARNLPTSTIFPEMGVGVVPTTATGAATTNPTGVVTFGTEQFSLGNLATQDINEYQDNVTVPWHAHTFTFGVRYEQVKIYNNFPQGLAGVWRFANITQLNGGNLTPNNGLTPIPSGYAVGFPNSGNLADVPAVFKTNMPSVYGQDQWTMNSLTVTGGLRLDMPRFVASPLVNQAAADSFASGVNLRGTAAEKAAGLSINTSWMPKDRVYYSPRIGINWDPNGDQSSQLRMNAGIFTGPPPFILVANALQNNGLGLVLLSCDGSGPTTQVPAFTADVNNLPKACAGQTPPPVGSRGTNTFNINDPNFKYPQYAVFSGGVDHKLPMGFVGTFEALYKKSINGLRILDRNLLHPKLDASGNPVLDRNGRVLYADDISVTSGVINANQYAIQNYNKTAFTQRVVYLTNESGGSQSYNYNLTGMLRRKFGNLDWTGSYTYTRALDVQSLTSDRAISNWNFGREYSGLENDNTLTTSAFERRHRLMTYGTMVFPWKQKYHTDVTVFYEGLSGVPIDYVSSLDLNGDGQAGNDPIYVPKSALDTAEIRIGTQTGASAILPGVFTQDQAAAKAFDDFINKQPCLNSQRGSIMKRSSCFTPWTNRMDVSVRQAIPTYRGENFSVQLDIANFLNVAGELLQHVDGHARDWGKTYGATLSSNPQQTVLSGAVGQSRTGGLYTLAQPVYTFNATARNQGPFNFQSGNGYNLALTLRYLF